jgi:hypothetical protein
MSRSGSLPADLLRLASMLFTNGDCSDRWRSLPRRVSRSRCAFPFPELRRDLQHPIERRAVESCFKTGEERLPFVAQPDLNGGLQRLDALLQVGALDDACENAVAETRGGGSAWCCLVSDMPLPACAENLMVG